MRRIAPSRGESTLTRSRSDLSPSFAEEQPSPLTFSPSRRTGELDLVFDRRQASEMVTYPSGGRPPISSNKTFWQRHAEYVLSGGASGRLRGTSHPGGTRFAFQKARCPLGRRIVGRTGSHHVSGACSVDGRRAFQVALPARAGAHYQGQRHASANSAWTIDRVWFLRRLSFEHRHDDGRSGSWRASAGPDWPLHSSQPDAGGSIETLVGWPNLSAIRNSNIISGLVIPSEGRLLFDDIDVTHLPTKERNIAQVFKFPVIYDTKTVAENLAFPLKNRRLPKAAIERRVTEIAAMLDLTGVLNRRARGLTADAKQKISLGRGLVRSDVSAVLFDEPLTVIDPALKWELRPKLKAVHRALDLLMIYVTHDHIEVLTFADQVVVMNEGKAVQIGSLGGDGVADADPMEPRGHDLADIHPAGHGLFGAALTGLGLHYNATEDAVSAWITIVVIDVWH